MVMFYFHCNICKMFTEGKFLRRKIGTDSDSTASTLPRDIHGAPPGSLVVKLSEVIGSFKSMRRMALFWCKVISEVRLICMEFIYSEPRYRKCCLIFLDDCCHQHLYLAMLCYAN